MPPTGGRIDQRNAYKYEYDTLTAWGVNAIDCPTILQRARFLIVFVSAGCLYGSIMIYASTERRLEKIVGSLYFSMTEITYICKLINYTVSRKNRVPAIDESLADDGTIFNAYDSLNRDLHVGAAVRMANRLATVFRALIVACIAMYSVYPFIDDRLLPLDGWFPFDVRQYRYALIVFQVAAVALSSLINSSIDIVTFGLISVAVAHFSILRDELTAIGEGADAGIVRAKIKWCCCYHNAIINLTMQIESTFSYGILMQFFASIVVICLTGFEMIVVPPRSAEFVMLFSYFVLIMCQVTLYCWFGHRLMIKSQEIQDACYLSDWYGYDPTIGRMLFIMMERSKRPVLLTAGKFFYLNVPTLVAILRSSYSYFAVLRRLYVKE